MGVDVEVEVAVEKLLLLILRQLVLLLLRRLLQRLQWRRHLAGHVWRSRKGAGGSCKMSS